MISELQRQDGRVAAIRIAAPSRNASTVLTEMGVDAADIDECIKYFGGLDTSPQQHLQWIFDSRGQRGREATRFTSGEIPVFYTALDLETACAEMQNWLPRLGDPVYFRQLDVEFHGAYKDLHGLDPRPAYLTEERTTGAYDSCYRIALAALAEQLDALKTPSARRQDGVCFPILSKEAVQSLQFGRFLVFSFDQADSRWQTRLP